jgi:hypothetical protein
MGILGRCTGLADESHLGSAPTRLQDGFSSYIRKREANPNYPQRVGSWRSIMIEWPHIPGIHISGCPFR